MSLVQNPAVQENREHPTIKFNIAHRVFTACERNACNKRYNDIDNRRRNIRDQALESADVGSLLRYRSDTYIGSRMRAKFQSLKSSKSSSES